MSDPTQLTALAAAREIALGRLTSEALVSALLERIDERDDTVRAWTYLDRNQALTEARLRDSERPRSPLHGVPVGVKDILDTHDMPTGHGSPIYQGNHPSQDASCVALLRDAGMVVMGKTVTTEFALRNPGATRNPHDPARTPGGSSSGSAAGVADFQIPLGIGTQTSGSIIRPASFCGVVGYKPTHGRIMRNGMKILAESLDTIGCMARSVNDANAFASIMEASPIQRLSDVGPSPSFALVKSPAWPEAEPGTRSAVKEAVDRVQQAGGSVVEIELPPVFKDALEAQDVIMTYEAWRALAYERYFHLDKLSVALKQAVAAGGDHTRERYDWARNVQATCKAMFWQVFQRFGAVLTPAAAGEAPKNLAYTGSPNFNRLWTMLGVPCVTVPGLVGPAGMPVGIQCVGAAGRAHGTLAHAAWLEGALQGRAQDQT
jgi:Asp-tRNA(Asn)/Glu-tRNA(Gln) amidotransferase A subunit family amidase